MADNEPTISMAGINAPPLYRLVEDGDKTVIVTADTNTPMWVINGKIAGGGVQSMTTAERTAITPEAGQLIYDTDDGKLYIGDGVTAGGNAISGGGGGGAAPDAGDRIKYTSGGSTINFDPVADIQVVSGSSVTLEPDTAYKMYATTGAVNVTANPPPANQWAYEGHAEIFVGPVGYVVFDTSKIVLANALEPDSVNNCTLRFHDGMCYVSVEDHLAGYIVISPTGTTAGTLPYALTSAAQDYVAFDATTNGAVIDLSGATASGEKHVVGNGYTSTTLTGAVDCGASQFTVANLGLNNVQVMGGTMTLGDAFIPSGSTVKVSGGGLAVEKVTGTGSASVIDLGGLANVSLYSSASGVTIVNGFFYISSGGVANNLTMMNSGYLYTRNTASFYNVVISSGGRCYLQNKGKSYNTVVRGGWLNINHSGCIAYDTVVISGTQYVSSGAIASNTVVSGGSTTVFSGGTASEPIISSGGSLVVSSGGTALLVTSNAGAVVTVEEGGYITYKE